MSRLLSLFKLCPANNDILGVSGDSEKSSVICTLGRKIVYIIQLSSQKQIKSWSTVENFSSKVIYDTNRKQYVGVFLNTYLRFWENDTDDINKTKKIKFHKRIYEVLHEKGISLVVYEDGTCESLESALEMRKKEKHNRDLTPLNYTIENCQIGNGIFSYVKTVRDEKILCYTMVDDITQKPLGNLKSIKLDRLSKDIKLLGSTMVFSKRGTSTLITIWSDKRIFEQVIDINASNLTVGVQHSIIDSMSGKSPIALRAVSDNYIAIYASKPDFGSNILLFNIKYKIVQSKVPFKVYLDNFKLWSVDENLFLSIGQNLSVIPFVVTEDKLSAMIGSQADVMDNLIEKEMVNEDAALEEGLEFDENQDHVEGMEIKIDEKFSKNGKKPLSGAKVFPDSDEVKESLNEIYRGDIIVEVMRLEDQPTDTASAKLLSNIDESYPLMSENFEVYCMNLERYGCSEVEITNKVVPILIKANRTEDMGLLLKRYNHISERMLVQIIKYLLSCPVDDNEREKMDVNEVKDLNISIHHDKKKVANANAFLNTSQEKNRDVLSIALCCAFDSTTILKYLGSDITLSEMVQLMDHLYKILSTDVLDDIFDLRGNLIEGDDFDLDTKLFEWFRLLLDSHYQQILLSKDKVLQEKLEMWLKLLDEHIRILMQMNTLRPVLEKLANNKPIHSSKRCSKFYTIEKLVL